MLDYKLTMMEAVRLFGTENQQVKAMEELSELIVALARHLNPVAGKVTSNQDVIEEIADVAIMISQLTHIYGPDAVDAAVDFKMLRLHNRLITDFGERYAAKKGN